MAVPTGEGTLYVNALYDILSQKQSEYGIKKILKYEPWEVYQYPTVGINFLEAYGIRTDRKYMRFQMIAEIWLYYQAVDAKIRKQGLDDLVWAIATWYLKNQTLGGFSIMLDIQSLMTTIVEKSEQMISGRIEVSAWHDKVDVQDVIAGG